MNAYVVCIPCKQGKVDGPGPDIHDFTKEHMEHDVELVVESVFLEDYLANGFTDVDRPNVKPIKTRFAGTARRSTQQAPFGMPGAGSNGVKEQRRRMMVSAPVGVVRDGIDGSEALLDLGPPTVMANPAWMLAAAARPIEELRDSGLLWLINRTVFHPRGLALSLHFNEGAVTGWSLIGNGSEIIAFDEEQDDRGFERAQATLAAAVDPNFDPTDGVK